MKKIEIIYKKNYSEHLMNSKNLNLNNSNFQKIFNLKFLLSQKMANKQKIENFFMN